MNPDDQVIRPGGVTVRDVRTLSLRDLLLKEHGIDIDAPQPQSLFEPPQAQAVQQPSLFSPTPALNSPAAAPAVAAAPAPPPSTSFLEQARVNPGTPAPAPVPIMAAPSAGLIQATPYSEAPSMPGYSQARTGNPFRAPQAAPAPNLFNAIAAQPHSQPSPATEEDLRRLGLFGYQY